MNKQNWDDIRYVLTVARLGSLNAASTKLGVTHATVMRRVASFEDAHGQAIFQKSPSGYKLLPEAVPILRSIEGVEEATLAMERTIAGADQSPSGKVRIASTDSLCNLILPPIISTIDRTFPKIDVSLLSANLHHDLSRLSADIVVRATNKLDETLAGQSVGRLTMSAYSIGSTDLPWLTLEGALKASAPAEWLKANVGTDQMIGGADSFLALQQLAANGVGKTLLPNFVGNADPRLMRLEDVTPTIQVQIWVASLKEFAHVPRFSSVSKLLVKELRKSEYFA